MDDKISALYIYTLYLLSERHNFFKFVYSGLFIYNMYRRQRKLMSVVVERAPAAEEKVEEDNPQVDERFAGLFQRMKVEIEEKKLFKDQNLSRDGIASLLGTNRSYITDATKMMTGMSFPQYISSLRISEAERLLQNPKEDVSNLTLLGESLGFSSLSAFQSTFKKYTGMTLSAYREIARKKRG
jgi:AraC-like DNA-binding protein